MNVAYEPVPIVSKNKMAKYFRSCVLEEIISDEHQSIKSSVDRSGEDVAEDDRNAYL